MERPSKELLVAIALVVAIVATGHLWTGAADACSLSSGELAGEMRKANGCFEFWANRYQTAWAGLLGAAAALSAAWVAWHSIQIQIKRDEATAREAAQHRKNFEALEIQREIGTLNAIRDRVTEFQAAIRNKPQDRSFADAQALTEVSLPSPVALQYVPSSRAFGNYMLWTQRFQDLRNQVVQLQSRAGLSHPVPDSIKSGLRDASAQIKAAVAEGTEICSDALAEIDLRERRQIALRLT